jgi:hypothetical protein
LDFAPPRVIRIHGAREEDRDHFGLAVISIHIGVDEIRPDKQVIGQFRGMFGRGCANRERSIDTQMFHIRNKAGAGLAPRIGIKKSLAQRNLLFPLSTTSRVR